MDSFGNTFRKSAFGGFNREDVVNYIKKLKDEFYEYKKSVEKNIYELNSKIARLEAELKNCEEQKESVPTETTNTIDVSSSVVQINEAADHLRETADKICGDIGEFIDKILRNNTDHSSESESSKNTPETLQDDNDAKCEAQPSEEKEDLSEKTSDEKSILDGLFNNTVASDRINSHEESSAAKAEDTENGFSQVLSGIVKSINVNKEKSKDESKSILDDLLGSSAFGI